MWEPLSGTGERIVALIAVAPHPSSVQAISARTHAVLSLERLRALLGRQRGTAAFGVLKSAADYMTEQQLGGLPLDRLAAPFFGLELGPTLVARGYSAEQLLNTAVRTVSSLGDADDLMDADEDAPVQRHTVRTVEFLRSVRRAVAGDSVEIRKRFERRITSIDNVEMTVDYAFNRWLLQVTSLPSTRKQSVHAQKEAQSKLFELEQVRKYVGSAPVSPIMLINEDALVSSAGAEAHDEASKMLERISKLSRSLGVEVMSAQTPQDGARLVRALQ